MESGSFWSAYDEVQPSVSEVLDKDQFTLEDVLSHSSAIQDAFKKMDDFVVYLSNPEVLTKMLEYIIQTVPCRDYTLISSLQSTDDISTNELIMSKINAYPEAYRFPYICTEILTQGSVDVLLTIAESDELLTKLFSFLDAPSPLDPSCGGYFRRVVIALVQRMSPNFQSYVRTRNVIPRLLSHFNLHACMELLVMIGWDDGFTQFSDPSWLTQFNFTDKMLDFINPSGTASTDVQLNATRALIDIIVKCPTSAIVDELLQPSSIDKLFSYILPADTAYTHIVSILVLLVQHETSCIEHAVDASTLSPPYLFTLCAVHTPHLIHLLSPEPLPLPASIDTTPKLVFGEARIKLLELFGLLLRNPTTDFITAAKNHHLIKTILHILPSCPWNSLMHTFLETCVCAGLQSGNDDLHRVLMIDSDFVDWALHCLDLNQLYSAQHKGNRLGYMAYLRRLCAIIPHFATVTPSFNRIVTSLPRWNEFISRMDVENRVTQPIQLYRSLKIAIAKIDIAQDDVEDLGTGDIYSLASTLSKTASLNASNPSNDQTDLYTSSHTSPVLANRTSPLMNAEHIANSPVLAAMPPLLLGADIDGIPEDLLQSTTLSPSRNSSSSSVTLSPLMRAASPHLSPLMSTHTITSSPLKTTVTSNNDDLNTSGSLQLPTLTKSSSGNSTYTLTKTLGINVSNPNSNAGSLSPGSVVNDEYSVRMSSRFDIKSSNSQSKNATTKPLRDNDVGDLFVFTKEAEDEDVKQQKTAEIIKFSRSFSLTGNDDDEDDDEDFEVDFNDNDGIVVDNNDDWPFPTDDNEQQQTQIGGWPECDLDTPKKKKEKKRVKEHSFDDLCKEFSNFDFSQK